MADEALTEYPIDGTLDLHLFQPKEIAEVTQEYIFACLQAGIYELRIVHGKGKGVQRRIVHALLEKHPNVESYQLAGIDGGSWGATLVNLRPI